MLIERQQGGPSALPLSIKPINGAFKLRAYNTSGVHVGVAAEDDGTLRHQLVAWETSAPAAQIRVRAETDGTLRMQLIGSDDQGTTQRYIDTEATGEIRNSMVGWGGAALVRQLHETTGEQKVVMHGKDEAGNIDAFLTDENRVLWTRSYEDSVIAPPIQLPAADGILWNPGGTASELYEVDFIIINTSGAVTGPVSVGVDIGAGGSLSNVEYWMYQESLPWPGTSGWRGSARQGFLMRGADVIRGLNGAGANLASIHFRIRRIDTNL
jgi:hypothetical protein